MQRSSGYRNSAFFRKAPVRNFHAWRRKSLAADPDMGASQRHGRPCSTQGTLSTQKKLLKCSFLNLVSARCSGPGSGRNIPCRTNALVFMPMTGAVRTFSAAPVFRAFRCFRRYSALMRLAGHDNHSAAGRCDLKSFLSLKKQGCRRHPRPPQSGVQHDAAGRMNFIQPGGIDKNSSPGPVLLHEQGQQRTC